MIVNYPHLFIDDVPLALWNSFKILGVILDNIFAFEQHRSLFFQLHRKLIYRESLSRFSEISQSCRIILILLFYLVWSITHLFGVLQLILI